MTISPFYSIEQKVLIPVIILFCIISLYQYSLALRFLQHPKKRYIHLLLFFVIIFLIPHEIDPWNFNQQIPILVARIILDFSLSFCTMVVCLIVYTHFEAHYLTLRKHVPRYLGISLIGIIVFYWLTLILTDICVYHLGYWLVANLSGFSTAGFLFFLAGIDAVGFLLVYRLLVEVTAPAIHRKSVENNSAQVALLKKSKTYHSFMLIALTTVGMFCLIQTILAFDNPVLISARPQPEEYWVPPIVPAALASWITYTWWAWIPRKPEELTTTNQTPNHSVRGDIPPHGSSSPSHGETIPFTFQRRTSSIANENQPVHSSSTSHHHAYALPSPTTLRINPQQEEEDDQLLSFSNKNHNNNNSNSRNQSRTTTPPTTTRGSPINQQIVIELGDPR